MCPTGNAVHAVEFFAFNRKLPDMANQLWSPSLQIFQPRFLDEGRSRTWMVQRSLHSQSITQDVASSTETSQAQISTVHYTGGVIIK